MKTITQYFRSIAIVVWAISLVACAAQPTAFPATPNADPQPVASSTPTPAQVVSPTATSTPMPGATPTPTWVAPVTPAKNDWKPPSGMLLPSADFAGLSENDIAVRLFKVYLLQFQNPDADSFSRIIAFSDVKVVGEQPGSVDMGAGMGFAFIRGIEYSVQPASTEYSNWLAGNGDWDGTWMHGKSLFVGIRSTDEYFQLVALGSG